MSTIRRRRPRFEFVQILNAVARDYRVSWRARGLLTELLSYPADYETTVDELVKKAKRLGGNVEGRDAMRKAARELKDVGYIVETKSQNDLGQWITDLEVTDDPIYDLITQENRVSAGHTDDGFPGVGLPGVGSPVVGKSGVIKNTETNREGEEGDARARAGGEPSPIDEPQWGVAGGHRPAAPSGASASLIAGIARSVLLEGEGLTPEEHRELAALADMARSVVDQQRGLSWEEYTAWLRQGWIRADGRRAFRNLPGALRWRLAPEQIQTQAWAWACEQRGAKEASEARGGRDIPKQQAKVHVGTCGLHKVALTDQGKCLRCEHEEAEEFRRREAARAAAAAENGQDYVDYDEPDLEEIDPEELAQMYRSLGTPPTEAWQAARRAMEEARVGSAGDLTHGDRRGSEADPTRD